MTLGRPLTAVIRSCEVFNFERMVLDSDLSSITMYRLSQPRNSTIFARHLRHGQALVEFASPLATASQPKICGCEDELHEASSNLT